eukprot:m.191969 g.191969  ORF g.191969 m.191969 type:complete len:172 (-) comp18256_c0_seq6:692-1207(-)
MYSSTLLFLCCQRLSGFCLEEAIPWLRQLREVERHRTQHIVDIYGVGFIDGSNQLNIYTELMWTALPNVVNKAKEHGLLFAPESVVARVAHAIASALRFASTTLRRVHLSVRPGEVYFAFDGSVKLCISQSGFPATLGAMRSRQQRSSYYMAPERINPELGEMNEELSKSH